MLSLLRCAHTAALLTYSSSGLGVTVVTVVLFTVAQEFVYVTAIPEARVVKQSIMKPAKSILNGLRTS